MSTQLRSTVTARFEIHPQFSKLCLPSLLLLAAAILLPAFAAASSCIYSISPTYASFDRWGLLGTVTVSGSPSGCTGSWSSTSHSDWLEIASGGSGSGEGPFTLTYNVNSGGPRTGALTIAGSVFAVYKSGYYPFDQCSPGPTTLCIDDVPGDGRFRVEVDYQSSLNGGVEGQGHAVSLGSIGVDHGGLFWFFSQDNPEVLIKILNGCGLNNHYWIYSSAGTNLGMVTFVTDTANLRPFAFVNPDLQTAVPVATTTASLCP